MSFHSSQ